MAKAMLAAIAAGTALGRGSDRPTETSATPIQPAVEMAMRGRG